MGGSKYVSPVRQVANDKPATNFPLPQFVLSLLQKSITANNLMCIVQPFFSVLFFLIKVLIN